MKKIAVYLIAVVLLTLVACDYIPSDTAEFPMDHFDEAACIAVDQGRTTGITLQANDDPYFLDDKNIDAWLADADTEMPIETRINYATATGKKGSDVSTVLFATVENYYDTASTVELYLWKTVDEVKALLGNKVPDGVTVVITDNIEAAIAAEFDSLHSEGAEQVFSHIDLLSKKDFFLEATRCSYGKTGVIPTFNTNELSYLVTCAAIEVMSLYSYLDIEEEDIYSFYFDNYLSMRIWDSTGTRIPMKDNSVPLEMAANFSGRGDINKAKVLSRAEYDLKPGRYIVRWIRAESTKMEDESSSNRFRFRLGLFYSKYQADVVTENITSKLLAPAVSIELKEAFDCDSTQWSKGTKLIVGDLVRSPEKATAIVNGLDSILIEDVGKGIALKYDPDLPEGLFLLKFEDIESDTVLIYTTGGTYIFYQCTQVMPNGGMRFAAVNPNVKGLTFKEIFVSTEIADVSRFYKFNQGLYLVYVTSFRKDEGDINIVITGN